MDSTNAFAKTVGSNTDVVPAAEASLVKALAGSVATAAQAEKLKQSSKAIRRILEKIVPLLEKEKSIYASIDRVVADTQANTAGELWGIGIGDPDPILSRELGHFGIDNDSKQALKFLASGGQAARDKIRRAVSENIRWQVVRESRLKGAAISSTIDAMNDRARCDN